MLPSEILGQLIAIPSVNPMGRDVAGDIYYESRLSDWLEAFFRQIGVPHERIEAVPGRANVIARYDADGSDTTILLDAHQDTVPVDNMTIDPFAATHRDGKIFGRGAADVKGPMAAMLHAFKRLCHERPATSANVVMCCSCDEEATTIGVQDLVRYWTPADDRSRLLSVKPTCAVVAEPTELQAVVAHRGVIRFRVHATGTACHSSDPSRGKNAIYAMAPIIQQLEQIAKDLKRLVPSHPLCGGATLSVGRIDGGTSVNIVPAHCVIEIDRRIIPGEDPDEVWNQLASRLTSDRADVVCNPPWVRSSALDNENNEWIADAMLRRTAPIAGTHEKIGVPYCTHAATISDADVPAIVFGPGSIHQAHTEDEFIDIEQLDQAAEIYFRFCAEPGFA